MLNNFRPGTTIAWPAAGHFVPINCETAVRQSHEGPDMCQISNFYSPDSFIFRAWKLREYIQLSGDPEKKNKIRGGEVFSGLGLFCLGLLYGLVKGR